MLGSFISDMVLVSPSAMHGQADGSAWAMALLSWGWLTTPSSPGFLGSLWVGPMAIEPTCLVVSLATRLCTRMVLVSPSAMYGQDDGIA